MIIVKANDCKALLEAFCSNPIVKLVVSYECEIAPYLTDSHDTDIVCAIEDNVCVGYFYHTEYFDCDMFAFGNFTGDVAAAVAAVKETYAKPVFYTNAYYSGSQLQALQKLGFAMVDNQSSFKSDMVYECLTGVYALAGTVDEFRDFVESNIFPKVDFDNVQYSVVDGDYIANLIVNSACKYPLNETRWSEDSGATRYAGWTYLSRFNLHEGQKHVKFLIACSGGVLLGCICFGVWRRNNYTSISYVDVCCAYRNHGVFSGMAREVCKHIRKDIQLYITGESKMGKMCHVREILKKHAVEEGIEVM